MGLRNMQCAPSMALSAESPASFSRTLSVPDEPIIPFIEGDGIGIDVTPAMQRVVDAAVAKAYGHRRRIHWMEVYSGEKATRRYGQFFPDETLHVGGELMGGSDGSDRGADRTGSARIPVTIS